MAMHATRLARATASRTAAPSIGRLAVLRGAVLHAPALRAFASSTRVLADARGGSRGGPRGGGGAGGGAGGASGAAFGGGARAEEDDGEGVPGRGLKGRREDGTYYQGQWENMTGPPYRQPRPHLAPIRDLKQRHIPEIREDPRHKANGFLVDILEHEAYMNRFRDAESGGAFLDHTVADFDSECEEDAFYNEYLTEDEYMWPEDYEHPSYVPDAVKQQIYFLWSHKKLSLPALAAKFRMRTERVSAIIALKRSEPEMIAQGRFSDKIDKVMAELYGGEYKKYYDPDWVPDHDTGLNLAVLTDTQLPDDVVPRMAWRGNQVRAGVPLPRRAIPTPKERTFHARYAIKDISAGDAGARAAARKHLVVDFDGTRRPSTKREDLYRTMRLRRFLPKREGFGSHNLPYPDDEADKP